MLDFARTVGGHRRAHAAHVRKLLGASAPKAKAFAFGDTNTTPDGFANAAIELEELGLGGLRRSGDEPHPRGAGRRLAVVSVEARDAA